VADRTPYEPDPPRTMKVRQKVLRVTFAVESCLIRADRAETVVIKDAGDDPDVTHGARLRSRARRSNRRWGSLWT